MFVQLKTESYGPALLEECRQAVIDAGFCLVDGGGELEGGDDYFIFMTTQGVVTVYLD